MLGTKHCGYCGRAKSHSEFFSIEGIASVSRYCRDCHAAGKIKHGYGDYGDRFTSPEATTWGRPPLRLVS